MPESKRRVGMPYGSDNSSGNKGRTFDGSRLLICFNLRKDGKKCFSVYKIYLNCIFVGTVKLSRAQKNQLKMVRSTGCIIALLLLTSCSAYQLDSAQDSLRSTFASRNYGSSVALLNNLHEEGIYKSKDAVLLYLEQGTANHFAGNYDSSNVFFTNAEEEIDYLFTKSVSRAIQSFVTNDNSLAYDGEDYEDVYLNIFKSLNYIHMNELESALVEARRIAFKLDQLNLKYKDMIDALSKADTTGRAQWKTGETNVQNSAFGHYLAGILYAKTGKPDDARIEYENLLKAFQDQPSIYSFKKPRRSKLRRITRPDRYNLLITGFGGRAPVKIQNDTRIYLDDADLYLKFSLPSLKMFNTQISRVEATINDTLTVQADLIEEMDVVAKDVYKVKEPIIYARTIVRAFLKAVGSNALSREIGKKDETLGQLTNLFGKIGQEVTEKADLRSWQTMPGKAYATVVDLPPGDHNVSINYYSSGGYLLFADNRTVEISPGTSLELVESLYWN